MKLTENTKVRIKVPKHLYEAIQAELDKKHGMNEAISGKAEELKDFYEKVKEQVDGGTDLDSAVTFVMNDLGMEMMEENEQLDEFDPKFQGAMDVLSSIPGIDKLAQIDPFFAGVALVGMVAGGVIAAPKIEKGIKALMAKIKDPKKKAQLATAAGKENIKISAASAEQPVAESIDEDVTTGAQIDAQKLGDIAHMDPFLAGVLLVGAVAAGVIAGPKVAEMSKIALQVAKDKGANTLAKVKGLFKKKGIDTGTEQPVAEEVEEMEEALDLESLMEAIKDVTKKKAEDKKKKEAEAKKKKEADDKKKKEAEAKKKAIAAKKK